MTNFEFIEKAEAKAKECWDTLIYKHENHPKIYAIMERYPTPPRLEFDLRGRCAGIAYSASKIRLNLGYVVRNGEEMLNRTVPHEVAHCFNAVLWIMDPNRMKPQSHGWEWQNLMAMLGAPDTRCHQYDTENAGIRRHDRPWKYTCPCGKTFNLTTRMHNGIRQGRGRICGKCRGPLTRLT